MAEKNVSLGIVVIVALVVGVFASVATLAITGNTIKVNQVNPSSGGTEVYTKAEIDAMLTRYAQTSTVYTKTQSDAKYPHTGNVNANSCSADDTCEVNSIVMNSYDKKITVNSPFGGILVQDGMSNTSKVGIGVGGITASYGSSNSELQRYGISTTGFLRVSGLSILGNNSTNNTAFVCVGSDGTFMKKATPCA